MSAFQHVLSVTAIITTVSLFFTGIPICLDIREQQSTDQINGFPFVIGFIGSAFWLRYGMLIGDYTMIIVNVIGSTLMLGYLIFYIFYTRQRFCIIAQAIIDVALIAEMLVLVQVNGESGRHTLGIFCVIFNVISFGAPLAGLAVVIERRSSETLPLPLCTANLLVSSQWTVYGIIISDLYVIIPNGIGVFLSVVQMSLFVIFPPKNPPNTHMTDRCSAYLGDFLDRTWSKPTMCYSHYASLTTPRRLIGQVGGRPFASTSTPLTTKVLPSTRGMARKPIQPFVSIVSANESH